MGWGVECPTRVPVLLAVNRSVRFIATLSALPARAGHFLAGICKESLVKAIWNGAVIAESDDIVTVEGNAYFPHASVQQAYLRPSDHQTTCPWKGLARYYSLEVNGQQNTNAAWYYPVPKDAAKQIAGRVAFWKGVQVS